MHEQTALSQLLDQVTAILELRKKMPPVPGENFNVFSVMHMETKEVDTHCRLLYELLSPNGSHGMGDCFLESFFKLVLQKPYPGSAAVSVYREYVIKPEDDNYGRIDLLLQGKGFCYPIEVKVYAGDQWEQVKRYAHVSSDAQVYYLTLDGHTPSEDSLGGIEVSDVVCLSFADDIRGWLKRCGELAWNVPSVAEIIRQYIKLLDKLTGNKEGDLFMEQVKDTIAMSRANFESALAISKVVPELRAEIIQRFFEEIEGHMKHLKQPLKLYSSCCEKKAVRKYCQSTNTGYIPGLRYQLAERNGYTITLTFAIDWNFYWCLDLMKDHEQVRWPKDLTQFVGAFSGSQWPPKKLMSSWSLWWRYLPNNSTKVEPEGTINFWECNGRYTDLLDPGKRNALMEEIFAKIDANIEAIGQTGFVKEVDYEVN